MIWRWAVVVILGLACNPAQAFNMAEMASNCAAVRDAKLRGDIAIFPQNFVTGVCWGAFSAIQAAVSYAFSGDQDRYFDVCPPESGKTSQLVQVFLKYSGDHPERGHEDYFQEAITALQIAFPCRRR